MLRVLAARAAKNHRVIVASGPTYMGVATGGNYGAGTITLAIPAGCVAGDVVLLVMGASDATAPTPPSGSVNVLGGVYFTTSIRSWVFLYTLIGSDITAGTIAITTVGTYSHAVVATFVHGATTVSAFSKAYFTTSALTAAGITTTAAALLVYQAHSYNYNATSASFISFSTPTGYTLEATSPSLGTAAGRANILSTHATQAIAGASGSVSSTVTNAVNTNLFLFALQ